MNTGAGRAGRTAHGGLERALVAAGVGAGLGLVLWLAVILIARFYLQQTATCQQSSLSCLAVAAVAVGAALAVLAVLAWPLLRIADVRPAWPVALAAPPVAFILGRAYQAFTGNFAGRAPAVIVILMVSYAVAALLTTPGARRVQKIALTAAIIALYPAASVWDSHQQASANAASLTATGLPLLAAELPGYRITGAGAENPGEYITYELVPDSAPPELTPSATTDAEKITVVISHAGPLFAPPGHCASNTGVAAPVTLADSPPCQSYGHGLWVQQRGGLIAVFTRYGTAIIELDAVRQVTPEPTVLRAAEHLVLRDPSYFPEGKPAIRA